MAFSISPSRELSVAYGGVVAKSHTGKKPLKYATDNPREPLRKC